MGPLSFLVLAGFFAYLAFDARQFERTSGHRMWAVPPSSGRAVGVDPLSGAGQEDLQANKFTAVGGIPGLYWVFVVLSMGGPGVAAWQWFV